jgi:hypothetical protein
LTPLLKTKKACSSCREENETFTSGRREGQIMFALLLALGLLAIGTVLLIVGADWFLDGAADLARALGVSALVLGVVLAGL